MESTAAEAKIKVFFTEVLLGFRDPPTGGIH
jgi:hypothetical protein